MILKEWEYDIQNIDFNLKVLVFSLSHKVGMEEKLEFVEVVLGELLF